jgi:outer membrane protein TolC
MKRGLIIFLLIITTWIYAEYSIEECVESAQNNSYDVQISRLALANSKDAVSLSAWNFLPSFSFRSNLGRMNGDFTYSENIIQTSGSYDIFDSRYFGYKLAKKDLLQSKLNLKEVKNEMEITVYEYYAQLLLLKEKIVLSEETLIIYKNNKKLNSELLKSGASNSLDMLTIDYEIEKLQTSLNEFHSSYEYYLNRLNHLTNLQINIDDELTPLPDYFSENSSFQEFDYKLNTSWKIQEEEMLKAKILSKYNFLNSFPTLSFQYYYNYSKGENLTDNVNYIHEDWNNEWAMFLNLTLSLDNLKSLLFEHPRSKRDYQIEELNTLNMSDMLKIEIKDKEKQIAVLKAQLESTRAMLNITESRANLAQEQYRSGLISFSDLNEYRLDWLDATIKANELNLSLIIENKKLEKYLGQS